MIKLPTSKLQEPTRSMVRFFILGNIGTCIQYGIYYGLLLVIELFTEESQFLTNAAFTVGFVLEMVFNYFFSNYYTFGTKPDIKNAGGFLAARGVNYVLQLLCLNLLLFIPSMGEKLAGLLAIFIAGIANYFILRFFFKKKDETN